MDNKLFVSPSPHIHGGDSTTRLMRDVLIALLPALLVTVVFYGVNALVVTAVSVGCCILFEWMIQKFLLRGPGTICNLSAVLTGVLLAFNLPSSIPLWMVALGALAAIGIGKMSFGGLGRNPFNPALVGRVFLLISFPVAMTSYPGVEGADAYSGATPLTLAKEALKGGRSVSELMPNLPSYTDMLMGERAGSLGEIAALALLIGFVYLLVRKVITWHIPVVVLGTMAVFAGILWAVAPAHYMDPLFHLLTGGAILGAVYMATDYVTSPMNPRGMILYAVGIGAIT
ncbi:MAG: RnfABCDGE type electron transport complex subunit D, partial [Rikenellaceae bacterium]|nr:RnfABCDGE type electron transport complex subunit D [Rikenellaceae bacterium]